MHHTVTHLFSLRLWFASCFSADVSIDMLGAVLEGPVFTLEFIASDIEEVFWSMHSRNNQYGRARI